MESISNAGSLDSLDDDSDLSPLPAAEDPVEAESQEEGQGEPGVCRDCECVCAACDHSLPPL